MSLVEFIKRAAMEEGFDLCGIAPAAPLEELECFPAWIQAGYHGEMHYLAKTNAAGKLKRAALANLAPWARSVVVCAVNYNSSAPLSTECDDPDHGWISRYAFIAHDYHRVLLPRLRSLESRIYEHFTAAGQPQPRSWCYVDTGHVVERVLAQHSGIGWTGKNACILNQQLGSWLFLGVMLLGHALPPDAPAEDRCGSCTLCLDACPTQAFLGPRRMDATRCISYLTIEHTSPIAPELREKMGRHLFGCDVCQDVCPWNRRAPASTHPQFVPRIELVNPPLPAISDMNEAEYWRVFRGTPARRTNYPGLLRNLAIAMGNSGNRNHLPRLRELAQHTDPAIREHARWAIAKVEKSGNADSTQPQQHPS